jgi:hypothetical protein
MNGKGGEVEYEAIILVTRGDEMPKKNYEKKLHPTYEVNRPLVTQINEIKSS